MARRIDEIRRRIDVEGIVQGVGFRPYVFRLATERDLAGNISNTSCGVTIEVQGVSDRVDDFLTRLPVEAPPLSRITGVTVTAIPSLDERDFLILPSRRGERVQTLISADVATCEDCLREMFDPADRRHRYPFINCTNCGPRFTIVRDIPYDRPYTSMASFPMCPECQGEYDDPLNRRFHAQPNACWKCGPQVELWGIDGKQIECGDPVAEAASLLRTGAIIAVKGLGGFHLAVDATNADAVHRLRERKRRIEKPFAVMVPDLAAAEECCDLDETSRRALVSTQRPVVLLPWRRPSAIVEEVAPRNAYLGVFLPYTPLQHLLFAEGNFRALVMTSANLSEEPIVIDNADAVQRLSPLADRLLVHNRDILLRCDDSVVRVSAGRERQVRRSRGFVPVPVFLREEVPAILAVGGELKNTVCLTKGKQAFLSQHVGDTENVESYKFFEDVIAHLRNILEIEPAVIACDLHPNYFSTQWALKQQGVEVVGVQHHHAHIASCMAENQLDGRVIGFALDGTGYGTDGHIWGGEVLVGGYHEFERAAHFEYVPLPGGEAAIREPWRMGVSYLAHHYGSEFAAFDIPFVRNLNRPKTMLLLKMIERRVNSPLTSSCGRLFDAVSALAGVRQQVNYEGQAATELEAVILENGDDAYPLDIVRDGDGWIICTRQLFAALISDLTHQLPIGTISRRFHNGLVRTFTTLAELVRQKQGLERVCLSGGTFQNVYLLEHLQSGLQSRGFQVFTHSEVPAGDGGLSLGQALVAAHRAR